jgi:alkanesulfonate monooxygenase SsuD/methylene tetrahydromethanopterin reductase-like flavin-dependent oxidoreductase (luciferase family)
MWRESLEQIPRMWGDGPYAFEGKYFRMPERNVLPKPYSKPHPPLWVACSSPPTFIEAGELGLGALCFTFGTPAEIAEHVRNYKEAVARCTKPVGAYVNNNIAVTTNMFCLPTATRRATSTRRHASRRSQSSSSAGSTRSRARRACPRRVR